MIGCRVSNGFQPTGENDVTISPFYSQRTSPRLFCFAGVLALSLLLCHGLLAQGEGTLQWTFKTGFDIVAAPALGDDGVIYVGSRDNHLYAIEPDGTEKWKFETSNGITSAPAIDADGTIYVANVDGNLYAINPDGSEKWTFEPAESGAASDLAIDSNGSIYYAVTQTLYAVNPDGTELWKALGGSGVIEGVSIGLDGLVVATLSNGVVFAFNPQGVQQWQSNPGINLAPAGFAEDGTIYLSISALNDNLVALNPDGSDKWEATAEGRLNAGPSTGVSGEIYFPVNFKFNQGMDKGQVVSVDPEDGSENWKYETDGGVGTTPAVGFDGTIYIGTTANKLIALRPNGSEKWEYESPSAGQMNSSPTIAPNGTIYVGSTDDNLYAINGVSPGLSASSWSKFQRDVRNTGELGSQVTRRRWYASHAYWIDDNNNTTVTISHTGNAVASSAGIPAPPVAQIGPPTASFVINVYDRNGSLRFSLQDSVERGKTKTIVLKDPDGSVYAGAIVIDAAIEDGSFLAPHLTWILDVSDILKPLQIGAVFLEAADAALVHHFPAESNEKVGIGIGVQNVGPNQISCSLDFFNSDGSMAGQVAINLHPLASQVGFFDASVPDNFEGRGVGEVEV